jgi:hypothetical protein
LVLISNGPNQGYTLTHSAFKNNKAAGQGGALWAMGGPTKITDSDFTGNRITTTAADGYSNVGGAMALYAPTTIVNTRMANNYAGWVGGAISSAEGYPVSVQKTTFLNNTAGNPYNIQHHTSSELIDEGNNLQWPAKKTNFFNDNNATASITIASWLAGTLASINAPLPAPLVAGSPAIDRGTGASDPEDGKNNGSATGDSDPIEPATDTEPAPDTETPAPDTETPAPEPEPATDTETPAPEPEPATEPETPAPEPEPPTEPETPPTEPEPPTETETPATGA